MNFTIAVIRNSQLARNCFLAGVGDKWCKLSAYADKEDSFQKLTARGKFFACAHAPSPFRFPASHQHFRSSPLTLTNQRRQGSCEWLLIASV